jgi:hypothetical protein
MAQQPPQQYGSQESMSQQPTTGTQSQQISTGQQGQQYGQSQQIMGQQPTQITGQQAPVGGRSLEDSISDEMRIALHDFVQAANVTEWCADQCIDEGPQMAECIRLCRDVADLASLNVKLLSRDSIFGPEAAEVFALAAQECAQECARHSHKHCQECAEVLERASRSTRKMLSSFEGGQGAQMQGMQIGPQTGGQF